MSIIFKCRYITCVLLSLVLLLSLYTPQNGETALDVAVAKGYTECVEILRDGTASAVAAAAAAAAAPTG